MDNRHRTLPAAVTGNGAGWRSQLDTIVTAGRTPVRCGDLTENASSFRFWQ